MATMTPVPDMTPTERRHLGALEKRIAAGLQTFREVGAALLEIRDARLYRETHATFEDYAAERWALNRARAYQLIDSAKVVEVLDNPTHLTNEAQARELASLTDQPETAQQVWAAVEARAEETDRPVTANLIRRVKAEVLGDGNGNGNGVTSMTDRLVQDIARLGHTYQRWRASKPHVSERNRVSAAVKRLIGDIS